MSKIPVNRKIKIYRYDEDNRINLISCACAICYAIYSCFGLIASVVYMTVVIIGLAWTIYEMKHASMSDK